MSDLMVYRLHANVFAYPSAAAVGPVVELRGAKLPTLVSPGGGPPKFDQTLPVTFEQMQQQLFSLPRSDCEPDGFFLLTGGKGAAAPEQGGFWRLNGHMYEFGGQMHRIELSGECPADALDQVLQTMGWPEAKLVFELVQEGVTLDEPTFRKWAAANRD